MNALLLITKGLINGGDMALASKGFIAGGYGFVLEILWGEVIELDSIITKVIELNGRIH